MSDKVILLVEDNPDDAELTLLALKRNAVGNRVHWVKDGAEALDYLLCRGAFAGRDAVSDPALVLLDLNLSKVDGLEVLRQMRADARVRLTPVVILTSSMEERDVVRCYGLGANSYVRKPVDFKEFDEAARQLAIYWLTLNQPPPQGS
ncbi:MAG: chemotaxis protein CheY [Myxococcales bacterium]|nr:chemotaxis protein CheY [Myxococcales bacterium]